METRILICGGRDFDDCDFFKRSMDSLKAQCTDTRLVSGHAKGADHFAEIYADENGIPIQVFPADWKKYGKAAGPVRNRKMLQYAMEETAVIAAFWDGKSKGTGNMIKQAKAAGAECHIFLYEPQD